MFSTRDAKATTEQALAFLNNNFNICPVPGQGWQGAGAWAGSRGVGRGEMRFPLSATASPVMTTIEPPASGTRPWKKIKELLVSL